MSAPQLERECRTYARYLIGRDPDRYLTGKYIECHQSGRIPQPADRFERLLLAASRRGPFLARVADAYASRFLKYGVLRKKLVLTLALLECSPATFAALDEVAAPGLGGTVVFGAWRVAVFAFALALGLVVFVPARLVVRGR
jgi:hypothetical protein